VSEKPWMLATSTDACARPRRGSAAEMSCETQCEARTHACDGPPGDWGVGARGTLRGAALQASCTTRHHVRVLHTRRDPTHAPAARPLPAVPGAPPAPAWGLLA
jgi:hypothetical protein